MTTIRKHSFKPGAESIRAPHRLPAAKRAFVAVSVTASGIASASALGFALLAAGCSTNSMNRTYLPSGDVGFTINCSGDSSDSNWGECYKKAGEACGNYGYDVISKDQDNGAAGGTLAGVFSANVKNRSLVVKCKQ
jgi:hypothetical protein